MTELKIRHIINGRVVSLSDDRSIIVGQNYKVVKFLEDKGVELAARAPCPLRRQVISPFRLLCRLFRHEIRGFVQLRDNRKVVATRQGLYYSETDEILLKPALLPETGMEIKPPMTITVDSSERILWGEYWGNNSQREVRLFVSEDKGKSYRPFWTFKTGEVKHIHNILEDNFSDCYWVCVGDQNKEPGIGRLSRDLKSLDWLVKGEQRYRAVTGFVFKDKIVYGTDTEKDFNAIYAVDKTTGKMEKLCQTPGSCIYAAKFGKWYTIGTSVEYFEKYSNNLATLWISADAVNWRQVYQVEKDIFSKKYFQFGSIILPRNGWRHDEIVFSGQALKKIDNKVYVAQVIEG